MPIRVHCDACEAEYKVSDNLAGERIRCRECEAPLRVPKGGREEVQAEPRRPAAKTRPVARPADEDEDDRPRNRRRAEEDDDRPRRRRDEDDEDDRPRRRRRAEAESGLPIGLLIGGGVFLFLAVVGVAAGFLYFRSSAPVNPVAQPNNPVAQPPANNNPVVQPQANNLTPQWNNPPLPAANNLPLPVNNNPLPAALAWNVAVDAPPAPMAVPDVDGQVPLGRSTSKVLFPATFSPFVALTGFDRDSLTVYDLRTVKQAGTVPAGRLNNKIALSPDGTHVAAHVFSGQVKGVQVWTVADGKQIDLYDDKVTFLLGIDFAAGNKVVTAVQNALKTKLKVREPAARRDVAQFDVDGIADWNVAAFSPGRRYLAFPSRHDAPLRVYDLNSGTLAGELRPPGVGFGDQTRGLAFSADGTLLAALYHSFSGNRLVVWEVTSGKVKHDHNLGKNADLEGLAFTGDRRGLEWLPDGSGLLIANRVFLDAATGKVFWRLPADDLNRHPRRVLSGTRVALVLKGEGLEGDKLAVTALPADQIAAARKGGDPGAIASGLPAAKPADWSAVKEQTPSGVAAWKATADPTPAVKPPVDRPIPLAAPAKDIDRVLIAGGAAPRAAVLTAVAGSLGTRKQVRAEFYDLAEGQAAGSADLFSYEPKPGGNRLSAALAPDGTLLVVEPADGKRIDVYGRDGKHVVGWLPYEKDTPPKVARAGLFGADRAWTVSEGGRLAVWKLPECRAEWAVKGVSGAVGVSGGGKYVAARVGGSLELLDAATGERVGSLAGASGIPDGFAFRPDGKELAAVLREGARTALVRWDLTKGEKAGEFPVQTVATDELAYAGEGAILAGTILIDLKLKLPAVNYLGNTRTGGVTVDGRLWYTAGGSGGQEGTTLTARKLPDAAAQQATQALAGTPLAVGPGTKFSVEVSSGRADLAGRVRDALTRRLEAQGLVPGSGGVTLTVQIGSEQATGKTHQYQKLGGGGGTMTVNVKRVECVATLADARGQLWTSGPYRSETPEVIGIVRTNDLERSLSEAIWRQVESWSTNLYVPTLAVRGPRGLQTLPLPAILTTGGAAAPTKVKPPVRNPRRPLR
ncbi:MAG: WD40 repeat domain-containing protein [Gemmataceae bacterium]